jgi:predicted type IV restriction endonuclease
MSLDKTTLAKLKKFAQVFKDARDRNANESDTVMYLIEFFKEVLEYDPLAGEISKEVAVKDRYCDFGIRLNNQIKFLVEAKAAGIKSLNPKHIEQAGNYASRAAINWVLLTNGLEWQFYHLSFANGIEHDLVFTLQFVDEIEAHPDLVWDILSVLSKGNIKDGSLETYYEQRQLLSPKTITTVILGEEVLMKIRQELNRKAPSRLEMKDVFRAVLQVLNAEAVAEAGNITPPSKKRRRRRRRVDGQMVEETVDENTPTVEGEEVVEETLAQPPAAEIQPKTSPPIPPPYS